MTLLYEFSEKIRQKKKAIDINFFKKNDHKEKKTKAAKIMLIIYGFILVSIAGIFHFIAKPHLNIENAAQAIGYSSVVDSVVIKTPIRQQIVNLINQPQIDQNRHFFINQKALEAQLNIFLQSHPKSGEYRNVAYALDNFMVSTEIKNRFYREAEPLFREELKQSEKEFNQYLAQRSNFDGSRLYSDNEYLSDFHDNLYRANYRYLQTLISLSLTSDQAFQSYQNNLPDIDQKTFYEWLHHSTLVDDTQRMLDNINMPKPHYSAWGEQLRQALKAKSYVVFPEQSFNGNLVQNSTTLVKRDEIKSVFKDSKADYLIYNKEHSQGIFIVFDNLSHEQNKLIEEQGFRVLNYDKTHLNIDRIVADITQ